MHKIEISPAVMDCVKALRGRPHMFDHLDPARTAHIIVDLQNGFMEPGATVEIPGRGRSCRTSTGSAPRSPD